MKKVLTAAEMREVDRLTTEKFGIPSLRLMESAATAVFNVVMEKLGGSVSGGSVLIFCGKGNNGGDGAALARILSDAGASVYAVLLGNVDDTKGDALHNFNYLRVYNNNIEVTDEQRKLIFYCCENADELRKTILLRYESRETCDVIVDAILGTGVTRPLESLYLEAVNLINNLREKDRCKYLISIDLPSGLNADRAELIGDSAKPDLTVTFTAPKAANVLPPASRLNGELVIADIGSPQILIDESPSELYLADDSDAGKWLEDTKLTPSSYKKTRGHVLLGVGSRNYSGAAVLCANGAVKSGAGLVTAAVPASIQTAFSERVVPEAMSLPLAETENGSFSAEAASAFLEFSQKVDVAAVGCGLSNADPTRQFVREIVENRITPLVVDADGLNLLSPFNLQGSDELPLVLTPHQGEMLRLLGTEDKVVLSDRAGLIRDFAKKHHVILVLKGERTLIAGPGGKVVINPTGNEGLGKGGNGDTLTGIIASFLAQTYGNLDKNIPGALKMEKTFEAVVAALYIAGRAGDIAAREFGMRTMTASDVAGCLGEAIKEIT
ncbi:MAG TPA: NAD(P)H-hydrate dehydratase [Pyrinomonadaceae bacterium]|jgi:NAD(P)H-hydrate epimerase|nr:NAD(P)H-hydrate dehydratase [Pyrinomonadaceae bacterium]